MPSRKRLTFEERESLILETAAGLFSQKGYNGTTTKAIAQKARINEALIFRHYKTKEALYTALVRHKIAQKEKKLAEVTPKLDQVSTGGMERELFDLAKFLVTENRDDPDCLRMMTFSALENRRLGREFFKQRLPLVEFVEAYFQERLSKSAGTPDHISASRAFLCLVYHYIHLSQILHAEGFFQKPEDAVLHDFISILVKGVNP